MESADGQDLVSVHKASLPVDKDDPVRISIQGNSNIGSFLEDEPAQDLRMEGATLEIDILSIGSAPT